MVRWSEEEYEQWKRNQMSSTDQVIEPEFPKPVIPEPIMNKTEAKFADYLEQLKHMKEIKAWNFEPIKFTLARNVKGARNATSYTPDFLAVYPAWLTFYEVKGFWRDDALVKIKVAADKFPWFKWYAVQWKKEWVFKQF